eukprot:Skav213401  [mRNA]  locus=scaffold797:641580:642773:- [translate_table: standard]
MADCLDDTAWRDFAPCCLSETTWEVAAKTRHAELSHRSCPWGGHMIKIDAKNVFVQDAPEDPRDVLVRPEVNAMCQANQATDCPYQYRCHETYAPGYAFLERTSASWTIRLALVLFGHGFDHALYHQLPVKGAHRLCKDWPQAGNCTYIGFEAMWIMCRRSGCNSRYRSILVFRSPVDTWASWTTPFLPDVTDMLHDMMDRLVNGHTIRDMRGIDAKMYLVLSLRCYTRGSPLVPQGEPCSEHSFAVSRGQPLGLVSWGRFKPGEKFYLSEYLNCFMQQLGYELKTYDTLDGWHLVPYQCVVVRHEWNQLRTAFNEAFKVHRAAYRHANGGTAAPCLSEDAVPHFISHEDSKPDTLGCESCLQPPVLKTVVRNTFLELDEGENSLHLDCMKRSNSIN